MEKNLNEKQNIDQNRTLFEREMTLVLLMCKGEFCRFTGKDMDCPAVNEAEQSAKKVDLPALPGPEDLKLQTADVSVVAGQYGKFRALDVPSTTVPGVEVSPVPALKRDDERLASAVSVGAVFAEKFSSGLKKAEPVILSKSAQTPDAKQANAEIAIIPVSAFSIPHPSDPVCDRKVDAPKYAQSVKFKTVQTPEVNMQIEIKKTPGVAISECNTSEPKPFRYAEKKIKAEAPKVKNTEPPTLKSSEAEVTSVGQVVFRDMPAEPQVGQHKAVKKPAEIALPKLSLSEKRSKTIKVAAVNGVSAPDISVSDNKDAIKHQLMGVTPPAVVQVRKVPAPEILLLDYNAHSEPPMAAAFHTDIKVQEVSSPEILLPCYNAYNEPPMAVIPPAIEIQALSVPEICMPTDSISLSHVAEERVSRIQESVFAPKMVHIHEPYLEWMDVQYHPGFLTAEQLDLPRMPRMELGVVNMRDFAFLIAEILPRSERLDFDTFSTKLGMPITPLAGMAYSTLENEIRDVKIPVPEWNEGAGCPEIVQPEPVEYHPHMESVMEVILREFAAGAE